MYLQDIFVYPIKSFGGIRLSEAVLEERGLQFDRRWMLVDGDGQFLTQRKSPLMALLQVDFSDRGLVVYKKHEPENKINIPFLPMTKRVLEVVIWEDVVNGQIVDERIGNWLSKELEMDCELVFMPNSTERKIKSEYAVNSESVSFADGMPYLIIGQSSLEDLNEKLEIPVPMNRFRPNFVFSGGVSFEEDNWQNVAIGNNEFRITKPSARCVLTTIDQQTGERSKEPLQTLAKYRSTGKKVLFGQNMILLSGSIVSVGDTVIPLK